MPKATAVWLIDKTSLSFDQVADFVGMHPLEIQAIADGEVAQGIVGYDPVANGQLTREEIARCEADPTARLVLLESPSCCPSRAARARATPPCPSATTARTASPSCCATTRRCPMPQIAKLLGTTKETIAKVRDKTHWNTRQHQAARPGDPRPVHPGRPERGVVAAAGARRSAADRADRDRRRGLTPAAPRVAGRGRLPARRPRLPQWPAAAQPFHLLLQAQFLPLQPGQPAHRASAGGPPRRSAARARRGVSRGSDPGASGMRCLPRPGAGRGRPRGARGRRSRPAAHPSPRRAPRDRMSIPWPAGGSRAFPRLRHGCRLDCTGASPDVRPRPSGP